MSKVLSLITTLVIASNVYSQMDTTKIAFVSYWFVGDSYNYRLSKIKELWKEGHLTKDQQQDYRAGFTVIDSTATSYTIKWTYENNLSKDLNIPAVLMDTFSTCKLTEIKYKTSALGVFLEILNWREVGELMNKMFDDLVTFWGEKDKEEKERLALFLRPYKEIYSSKQGIEQFLLKELQYIHFPMGLAYNITKPLQYDEPLANMFGGKPLNAKVKLYFESVDFEAGYCVRKQEMNIDPKDTKRIIKQAV